MSEQTETPSLFPDEEAPKTAKPAKKPVRRKTAASATTRKPRAVKAKAVAPEAPETVEEAPAKPAAKPRKTAKTAAAKTTPRRKSTAKSTAKAAPEIAPEPTPAAAEAPAPAVEAPAAPTQPAPEPVVAPAPEAAAPVPVEPRQPVNEPVSGYNEPRGPRPGREDQRGNHGNLDNRGGNRNRRNRDNGRHQRRNEPRQPYSQQQQPQSPIAPAYAGAPVEEWTPRAHRPEAPAEPAAPQQANGPATVPNKPEELVIPRRAAMLREQGLSREERIAAARQQFQTSEPPLQAGAPAQAQPQREYGEPAEPAPEAPRPEPIYAEGLVEVSGKGFGFLRDPKRSYAQHPNDIFVTPEVCRRYGLRDGTWIKGEIRRGNRGAQLFRLTEIEGEDPEQYRKLPMFDELTTVNPNHFIRLETTPERNTTRVIDLMAPIGRGQRGLIVAPPRTGKTTYLQHIADAVVKNHPDMKLIILLVDERPEEVTDIKRSFPQAEVMASSNDQEIKSHTRISQLAIERARRLVEMGKHVFVLLDSITRLGRAFNNAMGGGGRTMSGGVDARALEIPRKLFASARNTEEAGSLTIVATALIETGSRMDDLIFQEFKGTGNMELVLDRKISDLRIYPAVDIFLSGTRREELLLPEADLHKINIIRRGLSGHKPSEAIERLLFFLNKFPTNAQMLREIPG